MRSVRVLAIACFVLANCAILSRDQPSRVQAQAGPKQLHGYVPGPVASGQAHRVGHHPDNAPMALAISLALRDREGLDSLLTAISDPHSPQYGHYLSQDEINATYNPTIDQEQRVTQWVKAHGLTVIHTFRNHLLVAVSGTTTEVEAMFHVRIDDYTWQTTTGVRQFYAPDTEPTIDLSVDDTVESIVGLDNFTHLEPTNNGWTAPTTTGYRPPYYPQDFANEYDVTPVWNAGYLGQGQHIAIVLASTPPDETMLDNFKAKTGANTPTYTNGRFSVVPPVDGGTTGPASTESALDVEYAGSMAPSSTMGFYEIAVDSTDTIILSSALDTLNEAGSDANNNIAISNSYRLDCENSGSLDPLYNAFQNVFLSNSATGHDYLFASGDEGKACNGVQGDVSYPASSQYVTSVGGTSFTQQLPTTATYVAEKLWTLSGAGNSRRFPLPSWQAGVPGIGTLTYRAIPDVSAIADYGSAETCPSDSSSGCITDGGTSLATPLWAGFVAIINQYVVGHGQQPLGFINPLLYSLAQQVPLYTAIHPMVGQASGSWASPTGLGSPDVWSIARDVTLPGNFAFQAEASRNTISSPAYVVSCGAWPCWGGYAVAGLGNSGNGTDGAVTMNQINVGSEGQYLLTIHYVNPGSGSLTLEMTTNGTTGASYQLPSTPVGTVSTVSIPVHLNFGDNTIMFDNTYGPAPWIDYIDISHTVYSKEAEDPTNTLSGSAYIVTCASTENCSGGKKVSGIGNNSGVLTMPVAVNADSMYDYYVTIWFDNSVFGLVNGTLNINYGDIVQNISFPHTTSVLSVTVGPYAIWPGNNTIQVYNTSGAGPDIDRIQVTMASGTFEAESAVNTLSGGAVATACSTCSGGNMVSGIGYNPATGQSGSLQFNNIGGIRGSVHSVKVVYANPDSTPRHAQISVDGAAATTVTFWPTGGTMQFSSVTVPLQFVATVDHTIVISNSSAPGPNVDYITIAA